MVATVTFDFDAIRTDLDSNRASSHTDWSSEYKSTWVDQNNPTDIELSNAIKTETIEKLENDNRVTTFEVTD